jgi:hypothetical protein
VALTLRASFYANNATRYTMNKPLLLAPLLVMCFLLIRCNSDDDVTPTSESEIVVPISVELDQMLAIQGAKSNISDSSYDVSGSLLWDPDGASVTVISEGNFSVGLDDTGRLETITGSGSFSMPDVGLFKELAFEKAVEVAFVYNTGKFFKEGNDKFKPLPLRDNSHYFYYNLLNVANGEDETMSIKNAEMGVTSYFLNVQDQEIIIPTGTFSINTPGGKVSVGNNIAIGLSLQRSFSFTPQSYEDSALNAIIADHAAFKDAAGLLYLAGEISLGKQVPMKLNGDVVIDGDIDELFTSGFDASTAFSLAMNGNLVFGHDLLDLIPLDLEVELASATLRYDQMAGASGRTTSLKFAGDFDDNVWMETLLNAIAGTNISQYVPFTGNEGNVFFSVGEDWELYANTYFAINTPHLGKQKAREGTLHLNADKLEVNGYLSIPYFTAEVAASGLFHFDGNFVLKARTKGDLELNTLKLKSNLDFTISNSGADMKGAVQFPYGLAEIDVEGTIDSQGLTFTGEAKNRSVTFGQVEAPMAAVNVDVNIRQVNPYLKVNGIMELPHMEHPLVEVSGNIDSRGMELRGALNTAIKLSSAMPRLPMVNASILGRSWQGLFFNGNAVIPYGIADASVFGEFTSRKDALGLPEIKMQFLFNGNPTFKIRGVSMPTSDLQMYGSSIGGLSFEGRIELKRFGYLGSKGVISGSKIQFSASYSSKIEVGDLKFDSGLNFDIGSHNGPNLATLKGWLKTPFNTLDVDGVITLTGHFVFEGKSTGCVKIPLIPISRFASYTNTFTFSSYAGYGVSGSAVICEGSCEAKTNCVGVSAGIEANWQEKTLKLCVPVPGFGERCFGI